MFVNPVKEFSIFAVFHKDVDFRVCIDDFIDLRDVLVKYVSLDIYLCLKSFQLLKIVA
jgi:hypothetical protein